MSTRLAYIVGTAGEPSERFIDRETHALGELGVEVAVYSIAREPSSFCLFCSLGRYAYLSVLPKTWRAVGRFPLRDMARLSNRAWHEFPGGLDLAATYAADARAKGVERVHAAFATKPAAVGMMMAAMLRVPFSMSAHARDVFVDGSALRAKAGAADFVAVCNNAALNELRARLPAALHERLALIRHGIDPADFAFRAERPVSSPVRILGAGRMVEKKGFGHLVAAMELLDGCVCEIAGAGPLEAGLRRQAKSLGLGDRVRLPGWLAPDALRARMAESDILAVPSVVARDGDRDGVPNIALEAAALGLPVVACDAGGVGEFVSDGETGRLVAPGDPAALADAVRSLISDPALRARFARAARKRVESEYNLRDNVARLTALLRPGRGPS